MCCCYFVRKKVAQEPQQQQQQQCESIVDTARKKEMTSFFWSFSAKTWTHCVCNGCSLLGKQDMFALGFMTAGRETYLSSLNDETNICL
jgi:hypothetical protein